MPILTEKELIEKEVYKEILGMFWDGKSQIEVQKELFERVEKLEYKNLNIKEDAKTV